MGQKVTRTSISPHFHIDAYVNESDEVPLTVYAIGDIHGEWELLAPLMSEIFTDLSNSGVSQARVVFLGDYIDRGAGSKHVVDLIVNLKEIIGENRGIHLHCLLGNHEQMLLDFLDNSEAGPGWISLGGGDTLLSYGVSVPAMPADLEAWTAVQCELREVMPRKHLEFFEHLERFVVIGDFAFAHAGVRPRRALHLQTDEDLCWIRKPFLQEKRPFEKIIVHGHTPVKNVEFYSNRVCIDTGAFATGILSALKIKDNEIELFQCARGRL